MHPFLLLSTGPRLVRAAGCSDLEGHEQDAAETVGAHVEERAVGQADMRLTAAGRRQGIDEPRRVGATARTAGSRFVETLRTTRDP